MFRIVDRPRPARGRFRGRAAKKSYMGERAERSGRRPNAALNLQKLLGTRYPLGLWDDEDDRLAEKIAGGEYFQSKQMKGH